MGLLVKYAEPRHIESSCEIKLTHGKVAVVDYDDFLWLQKHYWRAVKSAGCWYAVRRYQVGGVTHTIRMHREIVSCPVGLDVHHINGNSLDNRKINLQRTTPENHALMRLQRKFSAENHGNPTV